MKEGSQKGGTKGQTDEKISSGSITLGSAKIPDGLDPRNVYIGMKVWAAAPGMMVMKIKGSKGDCEGSSRVGVAKEWTQVDFVLGALTPKDRKQQPVQRTDVCTAFDLVFVPGDKKTPTAYVDDIIITDGPSDAAFRKMDDLQKAVAKVSRTWEKDGFECTPQSLDQAKTALNAAPRHGNPRHVLVIGPNRAETTELASKLAAAALKAKLSGYTFVAATTPDGQPAFGLDDMRALLSYLIANPKTAAGTVILLPATVETTAPSACAAMEVVVQRAMEQGCLPLVVVPPGAKEDFDRSVKLTCAKAHALCLIGSKGGGSAVDNAAGVAVTVLQHLDLFMKR